MKIQFKIQAVVLGFIVLFQTGASHAGVPLNNVEGVGGIAFNPLAYTAGTPFEDKTLVNKPQFGVWRIRLNDVKADWTTASIATTFFDRLEVSYGNETIAQSGATNIHKNNIGVFDHPFVTTFNCMICTFRISITMSSKLFFSS